MMPSLSPYIFIFCVEILAKKIRQQKDIKGVHVSGKEIKISQYAEDTTLILDDSKTSFLSSLTELDRFSQISGLKLNNKKNGSPLDRLPIWEPGISLPGKKLKMG